MKRGTQAGGLRHAAAGLTLLTESELAEIQRGSLEVLERTGVWVEADEILDIFADGGCRVNRETHIVKFPGHVVEEAIASAPQTFRLCGRDPRNDVMIGGDGIHFLNFGTGIRVNDRVTGENRDSVKSDVADAARLIDWCSELDVLLEPVVPGSTGATALHLLDQELRNCTKPAVCGPGSAVEAQACLDLLAAVFGEGDALRERPPIIMGGGGLSPLQLDAAIEVQVVAARAGLPVACGSMVMAGATGPQTLAGTLVLAQRRDLGPNHAGAAGQPRQSGRLLRLQPTVGPALWNRRARHPRRRVDQPRRGSAGEDARYPLLDSGFIGRLQGE